MSRAFVIEKSAPQALNVVGEQITVLASGDQTGSYEVFHQAGPEGSRHHALQRRSRALVRASAGPAPEARPVR